MSTTLTDRPDWGYLLREILEIYRRSPAGGSAPIRTHQRAVRTAMSKALDANPVLLERPRETKPVTRHLARALDNGRTGALATVIRTLDRIQGELSWLYGYEKVPRGLAEKYAYAELAGPKGPVESPNVIIGLVLFAPRCTYPAHSHDGITESYYVLSGAVSENDEGVYAPGSMILNPPGRKHRITTSDREPALLAYAWHGPPDKLAEQKMVFQRARSARLPQSNSP